MVHVIVKTYKAHYKLEILLSRHEGRRVMEALMGILENYGASVEYLS